MPVTLMLLVVVTFVSASLGALEEKVRYYEVLHSQKHVQSRTKRSMDIDNQSDEVTRTLTLSMFNQTFTCHLKPRTNFFSPTFRLVVMRNGKESLINDFQKDQFLVGTCDDDSESEVHGYFVEDVFTGTIKYDGIVYAVEDAVHHMAEEEKEEYRGKMIAYRSSDINWDKTENKTGNPFCGVHHEKETVKDDLGVYSENTIAEDKFKEPHSRAKRETPRKWSTCRMIAVADHKFFKYMGSSNIYTTATYVAGVIERVDSIFRSTVWNIGYDISGMGFELAEMRINEDASSGYNADKSNWDPLGLLQTFGHDLNFTEFCVAHLFTYERFDNNVLGLAYIASPTEGSAGGMCSLTRAIDGQKTALNTGWSTSKDSAGETVLTRQAELVTAHGHNWGAEHDPDTSSCSPSSVVDSGKYLMYAYSVSGYDSNNNKFSPCSRRDIGTVLAAKAQKCFSATPENSSCGNGLIDEHEECDAGYLGHFGLDPCCTKACLFSSGATCSPVNYPCCFGCRMAPRGYTCQASSNVTCIAASTCTGNSLLCPEAANKLDNSTCLDEGLCRNGTCLAFCEARGKVSCTCSKESESCQRCCRDAPQAECKPYNYRSLLPDGRPCVVGYCQKGICKKTETSLIQRLFNVFETLTVDGVLEFFRKNIVGCIIVFTLLLWIPISCCISLQGVFILMMLVAGFDVIGSLDRKKKRGVQRDASELRMFSVSSID